MNALTLHAMDESLVLALRKYAAEFGTSLNYASVSFRMSSRGGMRCAPGTRNSRMREIPD